MGTIEKIKRIGLQRSIKIAADRAIKPFVPGYYKRAWAKASKQKDYSGVNCEERDEEIVVSLTTFPKRIHGIQMVIETLLMQTLKPDKVVLWLAEEQFPNKEAELPDNLLELRKYGLSIQWYHDIRSYKKLIPSLLEYPEAIIITADDDMYYHPKMVERLYKAYKKEPNYIHCHRVTKFYMEGNEFKTVAGGYEIYSHASFLHKLTGGSGALYPPHSLYKDIINEDLFMKLAPTNDDIWFWLMAALNGKRCNVVKHSCTALYFIEGSQEESLNSINDNGEKLFWVQFNNMLDYYPEVKRLLKNEWNKEKR